MKHYRIYRIVSKLAHIYPEMQRNRHLLIGEYFYFAKEMIPNKHITNKEP